MGKFSVGDVVLVTFPFSNLKGQKIRPALVVANVEFENLILCQITSKPYSSNTSIRVQPDNFSTGELPVISYVRPDKLFTADLSIIKARVGQLKSGTIKNILKAIRTIFV